MAKTKAQLDREIAEALVQRRNRSHATKRDRADELIASYGTWKSTYSNEDLDRAQGLANRLTAIDREEGRAAPPVGFSKERYAQAKQVVEDTNLYGEKQQRLHGTGRSHARKKALDRGAPRSKRASKPEKEQRVYWIVQQREHSGSRSWFDIGDWQPSEKKANAYMRSIVEGGTNAPNLFRVKKIVT